MTSWRWTERLWSRLGSQLSEPDQAWRQTGPEDADDRWAPTGVLTDEDMINIVSGLGDTGQLDESFPTVGSWGHQDETTKGTTGSFGLKSRWPSQ